ncbi:MAG: ThaI family type II restriction endonuclease [Ignavibacteria bacterium]|nr:ThaI family type II restriction endonuclease [Ignavibacteria bacterium]
MPRQIIKTISGANLGGFKLISTIDVAKAKEFYNKYNPRIDILLAHINWKGRGGIILLPF